MTLQFDPSPYLEAFRYGQNRDQQDRNSEAQGIQGIGQGIAQLAQIPGQQRDARMSELMAALKLKEQGIDPSNAMSYLKTGQLPSSQPMDTSSPAASPMQSPSPSPMFGQMPSGGSSFSESDQGMGPNIPSQAPAASPVIDAWNSHPDRTQFAPRSSAATANPSGGFGALFKSSSPTLKDRLTESEISKNNATAQDKLAPEATTPVRAVVAMFPHLKGQQDALNKEFPNGMTDKHLSLIAGGQKSEAGLSEKQSQEDRKRWDQIVKDTDPYKASSRSPLGIATIGNQRAARAIPVLQNPKATNQDINTAIADISGIFQGGVPTESGIHEQEYNTWLGKLSDLKTTITGKPSAPAIPEIKQHLIDLIGELKNVNNQTIKDQLDYVETAHPDLIQKNQASWQGLRKRIGVDQPLPGNQGGANNGGLTWQGRALKDTPANRAWLAAQGGAQ